MSPASVFLVLVGLLSTFPHCASAKTAHNQPRATTAAVPFPSTIPSLLDLKGRQQVLTCSNNLNCGYAEYCCNGECQYTDWRCDPTTTASSLSSSFDSLAAAKCTGDAACGYTDQYCCNSSCFPKTIGCPASSSTKRASTTGSGATSASSSASTASPGSSSLATSSVSAGKIAGIVIGTIAGLLILVAAISMFILRQRKRKFTAQLATRDDGAGAQGLLQQQQQVPVYETDGRMTAHEMQGVEYKSPNKQQQRVELAELPVQEMPR